MLASTFDGLGRATQRAGPKPAAGASEDVTDRAAVPMVRRLRRAGWPSIAGRGSAQLSRLGELFRGQHGSVAVESTVAIGVLVIVCGGLMAIAHAAYTDDRMGRAARAAARAAAFMTEASPSQAALASVACDAIRRELDLGADFDCGSEWTLSITTDLVPTALGTGANPVGTTGDMVLVEIAWQQAPWAGVEHLLEGSGEGTAVGLARREPSG